MQPTRGNTSSQIVIIGGGAAGIAVASSLLQRCSDLDITILEPAKTHCYQPGWTLVGGGVFTAEQTARPMAEIMPRKVNWIPSAAHSVEPEHNRVVLEDGGHVSYQVLIVCPGLECDWEGVEGLSETLGKNGVTSNYRYDLAPYTWQLVQGLKKGRAVFTQPSMPIKCAGAPQKAMYLAAHAWERCKALQDIDVAFYNAGGVLFGVPDYVPALMKYVERYRISLNFNHELCRIDGAKKLAWFSKAGDASETIEVPFDMIHVCPPQRAPTFVRNGRLADQNGWLDVNPETLRHVSHENIYGLGDVINAPNAKTAAAARNQAPIVAENTLTDLGHRKQKFAYQGYGSCPLIVERGKVVLAEFSYGGKLCPTFPNFLLDGTTPSWRSWFLKARMLPFIYWHGMLKGREWFAKPKVKHP